MIVSNITFSRDNHKSLELLPKSRYRAKTDSVTPLWARNSFEQFENCFLGVSLENNNFTPEKLQAIVTWISRRFSHCVVLVGDSIHRITLEATQELKTHIALEKALNMGESFILEQEHIFKVFEGQTKFTFETCSQIQASEDYLYFYQLLNTFFQSNAKFRMSVERFSRNYHTKQSNNLNTSLLEYRIHRSCEYFLEEFAIFSCLQKRGFSVMVYPGSFSTLIEIVNGEHPDIFAEIQQLVIVSLHFKKR